ncbi:ATP-binding cassette [Spiroplasma sp. TIUS-1]|uniref:ABC transporter ATP-binding protein n=1 Tax=Spiroplasma sp. TIUS-1 TaxID=216963 RepID=UPI0013989F45|nr:ABC transporter ATP-binding protein [Spiroplasma sp. TIUS-1]QHX36077.1 ATP-binding cassette [Spiroplasma sp. TIUS-1]
MARENKLKFKNSNIQIEKILLDSKLNDQTINQEKYDEEINKLKIKEENWIAEKGTFFSIIAQYYKKEWKLGLLFLFLTAITATVSIMLPLLTQQMIKAIMIDVTAGGMEQSGYWGLLWWESLLIAVGIVVGNMFIQFGTQYIGVTMGKRIEIDLRNRALEALIRQDISYYSDKKIGELITKVVSDTQIVGDQAATIPSTILSSVLTITASMALMFVFQSVMAASILGVFLVILLFMTVAFGVSKKVITKVRTVITEINGNVVDRINNVRLVKSSGTELYETERFKEVHKDYYKWTKKMAKVQAMMVVILFGGISLLQLMTVAMAMIIYHDAGKEALAFFTTDFASFQMAQGTMVGALFQVVMLTMGIAQASVASVRVNNTIESSSIMDMHYFDGVEVDNIFGDINFKDVMFAYPEKPDNIILPKFSFKFEQGKSYAFVGETGSGKSTIARMLLRFYDPTEGQILINKDLDLKDVKLSTYLDHVGYVEQEPQILYGNVYDNVKYGRFNATNEEVIEACKKADLHNLVSTWSHGYDTVLGERGFMLSGGQKQRLVIARMFLKDPQLLILDEATSALDNIVEKEIQEKLSELMVGRTSVTIAHRLSTIKNVDQIVVLGANGGGVVQTGTFNELKNKPGHFQKLYKAGLMD